MVQNGPNGRKWSKWSKMVKNGGPDLKRAQRTGLSARRARRTKSRGLKGLQLEVGARRAPRLLVPDICHTHQRWCLWRKVCHVEKFLHIFGIFAVLLQNLFCRDLRAFAWRNTEPKSGEKWDSIWAGMLAVVPAFVHPQPSILAF